MDYNEMIPKIPQNLQDYVRTHNCNLSININPTDAINGYGRIEHIDIILYLFFEYCPKCGYHSLFHKELWDKSKCKRHSLQREYTHVFAWGTDEDITLEDKFAEFLKLNNDKHKNIQIVR